MCLQTRRCYRQNSPKSIHTVAEPYLVTSLSDRNGDRNGFLAQRSLFASCITTVVGGAPGREEAGAWGNIHRSDVLTWGVSAVVQGIHPGSVCSNSAKRSSVKVAGNGSELASEASS
jgi:hypothetical protein